LILSLKKAPFFALEKEGQRAKGKRLKEIIRPPLYLQPSKTPSPYRHRTLRNATSIKFDRKKYKSLIF